MATLGVYVLFFIHGISVQPGTELSTQLSGALEPDGHPVPCDNYRDPPFRGELQEFRQTVLFDIQIVKD
jgi:hypothetical protein